MSHQRFYVMNFFDITFVSFILCICQGECVHAFTDHEGSNIVLGLGDVLLDIVDMMLI